MTTLTLTRDQARMIQTKWFPYLEDLLTMKIKDAAGEDDKMLAILTASILWEVEKLIDKKLNGVKNIFTILLQDHHAVVIYRLFMQLSFDESQIFAQALRFEITSALHLYLMQ